MNKYYLEEKKIRISTLVYAILIIIVAIVGIGSILAYGTRTVIGEKIAATMAKVIPFPAAVISYTDVVYLDDVEKNLASIEKFYQTQDLSKAGLRVDFTTPDGQKRLRIKEREILDKLIEDKIIEILARKQGAVISQAEVDDAVTRQLNTYGTANDVKKDLLDSYGWDMEDFKQRVVLPNMYKDALVQYAAAQNSNDQLAKMKIEQARQELQNNKDFVQVVQAYSEGTSKENGGRLGWVKKDQVLPELRDVLFGDKPFVKNSIVESSIGFHIIDIENKKKEGGENVLQIRQIFVAKNTFADWLQTQKKQMRVMIPMSDFKWDSQTGSVIFRDQQMQIFEKDARSKAQGDASLMF